MPPGPDPWPRPGMSRYGDGKWGIRKQWRQLDIHIPSRQGRLVCKESVYGVQPRNNVSLISCSNNVAPGQAWPIPWTLTLPCIDEQSDGSFTCFLVIRGKQDKRISGFTNNFSISRSLWIRKKSILLYPWAFWARSKCSAKMLKLGIIPSNS